MTIHKRIGALAVTAALTGLAGLGLTVPANAAAGPDSNAMAPQSWKCRDTSASMTGATVYASICWSGHTAKAAGQIYDTKADRHSACVLIIHNTTSQITRCDRKGAGTSTHFVTGSFHFSHPVWIRACTLYGPKAGRGDCSGWH
ncbi:hypothetical protein A6P39_004165 [Streptomyces sp. FXJ1.172]|uniref:hypothetical protein n=1 Tax=Streptomyces sp. FXJ1.172 TaxID=710705 RepID=UPI001331B4DA|nr:hypothetical protein [Streptomyces sp. FXJ1.172]WEO93290.1 hypothetical protein A6P39_004165 [Streptomyces sp. FXJ1.172]